MAGVLLELVYSWLRTHGLPGFPELTTLGNVCTPPVPLNVLNKFRNGTAPKGTHWFQNARDMMSLLLVGKLPPEGTDEHRAKTATAEYAVAQGILDYFFRKLDPMDQTKPTPFFRPERTTQAWSRSEIAGELTWLMYKRLRHPEWTAEAVWVSGGGALFPDRADSPLTETPPLEPLAEATADAITSGLPVTFITYPTPPTDDAGVTKNLTDLFLARPAAKEGAVREIDLSRPECQQVPGWHGFAGACVQYLYLFIRNPANPDDPHDNMRALYMLRGLRVDDPKETRGRAAFTGNPTEIRLFERWLRAIRTAARSAPAVTADPVKAR